MEDAMYDDDADLIEQVSDDEDENAMEEDGDHNGGRRRKSGSRRSDPMDDEPALEGYER